MALPVNVDTLIHGNIVESTRIETRIIHGFFHKTIFRVLSSKCKQIYCD